MSPEDEMPDVASTLRSRSVASTGALLGGLAVDSAGVRSLWMIPVAGCVAALALHGVLVRKVAS
jgi:hypothetical protein